MYPSNRVKGIFNVTTCIPHLRAKVPVFASSDSDGHSLETSVGSTGISSFVASMRASKLNFKNNILGEHVVAF